MASSFVVVLPGEEFTADPVSPERGDGERSTAVSQYGKAKLVWRGRDVFAPSWPRLGKHYDDVWAAVLVPRAGSGVPALRLRVGTVLETHRPGLRCGVVMGILWYPASHKAVLNLIGVKPAEGGRVRGMAWTNVMDDCVAPGLARRVLGDVRDDPAQQQMFVRVLRSWGYNYIADAVAKDWGEMPREMRGKAWRESVAQHLATGFLSAHSSGDDDDGSQDGTSPERVQALVREYVEMPFVPPYTDDAFERRTRTAEGAEDAAEEEEDEIDVVGPPPKSAAAVAESSKRQQSPRSAKSPAAKRSRSSSGGSQINNGDAAILAQLVALNDISGQILAELRNVPAAVAALFKKEHPVAAAPAPAPDAK